MDRRSFVKGSIGAGLVGVGAAAGLGLGKPLALTSGAQAVKVEFLGAKRVGGPAPRGLPILPIEVDSEGVIHGRVIEAAGGFTNLTWYKYCGHEGAPGLNPDERFPSEINYFITPDKIAQGFNPWYKKFLDKPMRASDFPEPGFGAAGQWRSQDQTGASIITAIVIATGNDPDNVAGTGKGLTFEDVSSEMQTLARSQVEDHGFLAFVSFCSHFCCVPGWKEADKALSESKNAWDALFCTCHFSVYDPTVLKKDSFLVIQEDEEEEGGGGSSGGGGGH